MFYFVSNFFKKNLTYIYIFIYVRSYKTK